MIKIISPIQVLEINSKQRPISTKKRVSVHRPDFGQMVRVKTPMLRF